MPVKSYPDGCQRANYTMCALSPRTYVKSADCRVVAVIRHQRLMSYDVFLSTRAVPGRDASGRNNGWAVDARSKWLAGNLSERDACVDLHTGNEYTRKMVPLLRGAIKARMAHAPAVFVREIEDWI